MSFIQGVGQEVSAGTSNAVAFASNNTAANLLVVGTTNDGAGPVVSTVTDSQGNTWARATSITHQFNTKDTEVWYALNCRAGANTVTVAYSGTCNSNIIIAEYSAAPGIVGLDQVAASKSADGTPSTALSSGNTPTTTQPSELLIGFGADDNQVAGQTYTAGAGFTKDVTQVGTHHACAMESQTVAATGAYAATFTLGTTDQWACLIGTFAMPFIPVDLPHRPMWQGLVGE
jgi:hypothetical protein